MPIVWDDQPAAPPARPPPRIVWDDEGPSAPSRSSALGTFGRSVVDQLASQFIRTGPFAGANRSQLEQVPGFQQMESRLATAAQERPITSAVADVTASVPTMLATGGVVKGLTKLPQVARFAGTPLGRTAIRSGATAAQFGATEALRSRPERIIPSALTGALTGPAQAIPARLPRIAASAASAATAGALVAPEEQKLQGAIVGGVTGAVGGALPAFDIAKNTNNVLIGTRTEKLQTQLTDRFAPVKHLVDLAERTIGRKLLPTENPYIAVRNYGGIQGRVESNARKFGDILKPVANQSDDLSRVLIAQRNAELSAQGRGVAAGATIKLKSGRAVPVETPEQVAAAIGPERFQQLQQVAKQLTEFNNNVLLADAVDAGIISKTGAQAMLARNQQYIPFQTLEDIADDVLEEGGKGFARRSFQVARQDAFKKLEGGAQVLDDPLIAQMRRIFKITALAERNRVGRMVGKLAAAPNAARFIRPLKKGMRPPQGFNEFTYFEDGKPTSIALPEAVADSLKGMTQQAVDFVTKLASYQSQALRMGATTLSPGFALTNPFRDFQQAKLFARSVGVPFNARTWARGLFDAIGRGQLFDEFERNLGSFGGFYRGGAATGSGKSVNQLIGEVAPTTAQRGLRIANTILNPIQWIQKIGETFEMAPRLSMYRQAVKQGKPTAESAFLARNATIDFQKSGEAMKLANMWVPFLNARLQGTINSFQAVKGNPLGAAYVASSMIGLPVAATYAWNTRRFPEVWKEIGQFEKDNNFILILGDRTDANGRYTQVFKIPKGDIGRILGNPLENALAFVDQKDAKSIDQLAMQILSDVSPVSFERDGKFDFGRLQGSLTPPAMQAAEQLANPQAVNKFTGFPVVPRRLQSVSPALRAKRDTSATLKRLASSSAGRRFGVSPIQTESAIGTAFGSFGRELLNLSDRVLFSQQNKGGGVPFVSGVSRRFMSARGGQEEERLIERALALKQGSTDASEVTRQQAESLIEELRETPNREQRMSVLQQGLQANPKVAKKMKELLLAEARGMTQLDRIVADLPVEARARFIQERLAATTPGQARQAKIQEFARKGLLTPQVRKALVGLARTSAPPTAQAETSK